MSKLSKIAGSRNWLFGRLAGIKNNLRQSIIGGRREDSFTQIEIDQLNSAYILIDTVCKNQRIEYSKIKQEDEDRIKLEQTQKN